MNVMSVEKLSVKPHALLSITRHIGRRSHMNVMIMRKVLVTVQILPCNKKSLPEKKPLIVMPGKRTSVRDHTWFNIKESIPKRNLMNVMNVGRHLLKFRPLSTSESSLLGEIMCVLNVVNPLTHSSALIPHQRVHTREKPDCDDCTKAFAVKLFIASCKFIQARKCMNLLSVVNSSCYFHILVTVGEFTVEWFHY